MDEQVQGQNHKSGKELTNHFRWAKNHPNPPNPLHQTENYALTTRTRCEAEHASTSLKKNWVMADTYSRNFVPLHAGGIKNTQ